MLYHVNTFVDQNLLLLNSKSISSCFCFFCSTLQLCLDLKLSALIQTIDSSCFFTLLIVLPVLVVLLLVLVLTVVILFFAMDSAPDFSDMLSSTSSIT